MKLGKFVTYLKPSRKKLFSLCVLAIAGALIVPSVYAKPILIDVRTPEEYQMSHPTGAINIPHNAIIELIQQHNIGKTATIRVYSRGGSRAEQAKNALISVGYQNVEIEQQK